MIATFGLDLNLGLSDHHRKHSSIWAPFERSWLSYAKIYKLFSQRGTSMDHKPKGRAAFDSGCGHSRLRTPIVGRITLRGTILNGERST